jgi:hypothetical protein
MPNLSYIAETTEEERLLYLTGNETMTYNEIIIKPSPPMFVT